MAARDADGGTGSACRRRERRLRSWAEHERLSVAMALAVKLHHSANRADLPKEEVEQHYALRGQKPARAVGGRPTPLLEVAGWQEQVQRHVAERLADLAPSVQILDAPVPQVVDNVMDVFRSLDSSIAEQVIEVPILSCSTCPSRSPVLEPLKVEQLVEVPTVLSVALLQQQTVKQPVDVPVPRGRGRRRLQGSLPGQGAAASNVEQIVDTQVPGRGNSGGVGARSLQRTAVQFADLPVPGAGGGLHGFFSGSMQRTVAQNDDIPAHSDDFRSFLPAQGSHESRGAHHHADQGNLSAPRLWPSSCCGGGGDG